jgi:hypothetical protein
MSVDLVVFATDVSSIAQILILTVGLYRVAEMRRGFVDRTYRSRALWSALLMVAIVVTNAVGFFAFPNNLAGSLALFAPFLSIVVVSYAFVDSTVLVATQSDFFHRDIFCWKRARLPSYVVLAASCAIVLVVVSLPPYGNSPGTSFSIWSDIGYYQFVTISVVLLGYGAASAFFGSRRTSDLTLKRHIRLLGIALAFFVLSLAVFGFSSSDPAQIAGDVLTLLATYTLYRSAMSLTSLGKVEKEA